MIRPRVLASEVIGHQPNRVAFTHALESGRLGHAYLLVGAEGVGKRLFAEAVAAAVLCPHGSSVPCGDCASCRTLVSGNHPGYSVLEPAGTTIEIGQVRTTIQELSVRTGDRRVVIVDPTEAMPATSANAFLKTLEEPPAGILFLLITSRPAQLLDTIISRCHRVPFTGLSPEEFRTVLERVDVPADEVESLFRMSDGSPGLAVRLRDGIAAAGGAEQFEALISGSMVHRPEALIDLVPPLTSSETKRDRVRRLVELVLDGIRGRRDSDPDRRERLAEQALHVAELHRKLDSNLNGELVLERLARLLAR